MSWINKLTYYPNGKTPEDPNNENPDATTSGTSYEIGTTFDKVFYKNKAGTVTNFSLISFIDIIKEFFGKKGFMLWGEDTPEDNSNIVEWYQSQIIRDPVLFNLKINQIYDGEERQTGYYELIGDSDSPNFLREGRNFNFSVTVDENNNSKLSSEINIDPDCSPRAGDGSSNEHYYFYTLKSKILGIDTEYRLRIQIVLTTTDPKSDRKITLIQKQDNNNWITLDDNSYLTFNLTKYYTITFIQPSENNNIDDSIIETLYIASGRNLNDNECPKPPEKEGFNGYWSKEKNGSEYSLVENSSITEDLTLYAVYTEITPENTDDQTQSQNSEDQISQNSDDQITPENPDEVSQG